VFSHSAINQNLVAKHGKECKSFKNANKCGPDLKPILQRWCKVVVGKLWALAQFVGLLALFVA